MNFFNFILQGLNSVFAGWFTDGSDLLPGSSFHAITAAFATQGYWAQADFIYFINETGFQSFAVLVYLGALIAGIVGMAMGAPPKQYLWYFMGPALFHFLLGTTTEVYGTAWRVAGEIQEQSEVWKLAETGLNSSNIAERENIDIRGFAGPSAPVKVSWFFAHLDAVVSDVIQAFISWIGVYELKTSSDKTKSTLVTPSATLGGAGGNAGGRWHLLSNLKWGYLDTITSARLNSPELRDGFINFMASTCGDKFQQSIDPTRYISAGKSQNGTIPAGIFTVKEGVTQLNYAENYAEAYRKLNENLAETVPIPMALRRVLGNLEANKEPSSFKSSIKNATFVGITMPDGSTTEDGNIEKLIDGKASIKCSHYLDLVVKGFRWEASHLYDQLRKRLPGVNDSDVLDYAMLFGWDIRKYTAKEMFGSEGSKAYSEIVKEDLGKALLPEESKQYLVNLIFINMMKNEFLLAPNAASRKLRFTSGETSQMAIEMYQKTVGSRNKFGEIYSWALMMPYLQGLLLYILALGYPFACVMILIPKLGKIIFTWSSFWIWAKLWDLGFAIVTLLERSVWATIGNSAKATQLNPFIAQMGDWGKSNFTDIDKVLPTIELVDTANSTYSSYRYIDRAMTLFSNMDLDLQNSYYIYIMAALYFAVPAITGQLVLGGKASIAGLVTGAFSEMAKETGSKAGAAHQAQVNGMIQRGQAVQNRAFALKALGTAEDGGTLTNGDRFNFAKATIGAQTAMAGNNLNAGALQAQSTGMRGLQTMVDSGQRLGQRNLQYETEMSAMLANPNTMIPFIANMAARNIASGGQGLTRGDVKKMMEDGTWDSHTGNLLLNSSQLWNGQGDNAKINTDALNQLNSNRLNNNSGASSSSQGGRVTDQTMSNASPLTGTNSQQSFGGGNGFVGTNGGMSQGGNQFVGAGLMTDAGKWTGQSMANYFGTGVDIDSKTGQFILDSRLINSQAYTAQQTGDLDQQIASMRAFGEMLNMSSQRASTLANGTSQDSALDGQNDYFLQAANSGMLGTYNVSNSGAFNTEATYLAGSGQLGRQAQSDFNQVIWQGDKSAGLFSTHSNFFNELQQTYGSEGLYNAFKDASSPWALGGALKNAKSEYDSNFRPGAEGQVGTWGLAGGYHSASENGLGVAYGNVLSGGAGFPNGQSTRPPSILNIQRVDEGPTKP